MKRCSVTAQIFFFTVVVIPLTIAQQKPEQKYWTWNAFPNPRFDYEQCRAADAGFVCDPNGRLNVVNSEAGSVLLNRALKRVRDNTKCACQLPADLNDGVAQQCDKQAPRGYSIAVALVDYMAMTPEEEKDESAQKAKAEEFATGLRRKWQFGQCNDDATIFVSAGDRKVWTAVGLLTGKLLSQKMITDVTRTADEYFFKQDFTGGLLYMVEQYERALQGKEVTVSDSTGIKLPLPLWLMIVIAVVVILVLLALIGLLIKCCCSTKSSYQMGRQTS